jgi:hypothetical protein
MYVKHSHRLEVVESRWLPQIFYFMGIVMDYHSILFKGLFLKDLLDAHHRKEATILIIGLFPVKSEYEYFD